MTQTVKLGFKGDSQAGVPPESWLGFRAVRLLRCLPTAIALLAALQSASLLQAKATEWLSFANASSSFSLWGTTEEALAPANFTYKLSYDLGTRSGARAALDTADWTPDAAALWSEWSAAWNLEHAPLTRLLPGLGKFFEGDTIGRSRISGAGHEERRWVYLKLIFRF